MVPDLIWLVDSDSNASIMDLCSYSIILIEIEFGTKFSLELATVFYY